MTRLFLKLALSGLSRRRLQTALTIVVIAGAAATLTLALGVGTVADRPWERTFEATNGAHVTGVTMTNADLSGVERLPGVVASTGVLPITFSTFRDDDGKLFGLRLIALGRSDVTRPLLERGHDPGANEVLLERSFAKFKGFVPGDRIVVGSVPLTVSGIGVIPQGEAYPRSQPGWAFTGERTLARIQPDRSRWWHFVGVRLANPEESGAFMTRARAAVPRVQFDDWKDERVEAAAYVEGSRVVLSMFAILLSLAGGFVLATLIGGRVLAQAREIALLKAAGLKPGQVSLVFLIEQLMLAVVALAIGVTVGTLVTPAFVTRSATLLNASEVPSFDVARVGVVTLLVLAIVAVFTLLPSWRAGRRTTAAALVGGSLAPRRSRLGALTQRLRLPLPLSLGSRAAFAHPGRATITALCLGLTIASVITTLGMEASLRVATEPPPAPALAPGVETPAWDPVDDDAGEGAILRPIVYGLDAVLLFVGLTNLLATILLTLRERVRDLGVLKAVGLTPKQVTASFLSAQTILAGFALVIGIPLGYALFRLAIEAADAADEFAYPKAWWVALVVPAAFVVVLALSAPLARRAAALPVTESLRYE